MSLGGKKISPFILGINKIGVSFYYKTTIESYYVQIPLFRRALRKKMNLSIFCYSVLLLLPCTL